MDGGGKVGLITIIDVVSRFRVESSPCLDAIPPPLGAYQLALRRAVLSAGRPRRLPLDHGTGFYDNTSPSPFPPRLPLGLLALGIAGRFARKRCPPDHARIERTQPTPTRPAAPGQRWPDQRALWAGLDARRARLNRSIPSPAWPGQAPLQASPAAAPSGRAYRPEWGAERLDLGRVSRYLASCRWLRYVKANGRRGLGGYASSLGPPWRSRLLELRFDPAQGCCVGPPEGSDTTRTLAPQGLTPADLRGELADLRGELADLRGELADLRA